MKHVPAIKDYVKPLGPYSHAVVANGFVFVSGQTGLKPGGAPGEYAGPTVQDQTRQALRNIETILKDLGLMLADVVRATVYLANPADFKSMNDAYREFFPEEPPARSVARLGAEVPGLLVTIDAIAVYAPHAEE
ncbi:MAG TPA: RidA family protein [Thermoplasmata archaeon]|nr:RidA family protein [Thermoplasmata archaeon]